MPTRPVTPSPGDVLAGKYRVERVIGEGGMGVVVAATHLQLDQVVALKFTTIDSGPAAARFLREAKSAVRLKSEHVARVTDVGTLETGAPYMVMEYLDGQDLSELLRQRGPLPIADAVGYVVQACEAVAEAHALGIVHRDLKPHNLFLTTSVSGLPKVKVLDFGISKTMTGELALTRTAEIVGTPSYMSPEQLRSAKDVDQRTDLWALGVILYELLTARLPFEAETLPQLCSMVAFDTPQPPTAHRPDIPPPLSDAVMRCLSRDPAARFADAGDLAAALEPYAPEWASAQRVAHVSKSSSSSASGRAVIHAAAPSKPSATDAAWSETELAPKKRPWPRLAIGSAIAVAALGAAVFVGLRVGEREASTTGAGPAATVPSIAVAAPPPSAPAPLPEVAAAPTPTAAPTPAPPSSAPTPAASSVAAVAPPHPAPSKPARPKPGAAPAAGPSTPPASPPAKDDEGAYEHRR